MMAISQHPRCAGYLKALHFNLNDPSMTDYGWAVALSENWTDEFLVKDGRVNFDTMDGRSILTEFDRLLRDNRPTERFISNGDMERLKAFFGARGIKTSTLQSAADYWHVAAILWPEAVRQGFVGTHGELLSVISSMTKKARQSANRNLANVPGKWRAS